MIKASEVRNLAPSLSANELVTLKHIETQILASNAQGLYAYVHSGPLQLPLLEYIRHHEYEVIQKSEHIRNDITGLALKYHDEYRISWR